MLGSVSTPLKSQIRKVCTRNPIKKKKSTSQNIFKHYQLCCKSGSEFNSEPNGVWNTYVRRWKFWSHSILEHIYYFIYLILWNFPPETRLYIKYHEKSLKFVNFFIFFFNSWKIFRLGGRSCGGQRPGGFKSGLNRISVVNLYTPSGFDSK